MIVSGLNHIAVACRDISRHLSLFSEAFGLPHSEITEVPSQGVKVAFIRLPNVMIELVAPLDDESSLNKFLERRGEGLHHISLSVDDIHAALAELRAAGIRTVDTEPRPGAEGKTVAFLHPKTTGGVLIELEEE